MSEDKDWADATTVGSAYEVQISTRPGGAARHRPIYPRIRPGLLTKVGEEMTQATPEFPWRPGYPPEGGIF